LSDFSSSDSMAGKRQCPADSTPVKCICSKRFSDSTTKNHHCASLVFGQRRCKRPMAKTFRRTAPPPCLCVQRMDPHQSPFYGVAGPFHDPRVKSQPYSSVQSRMIQDNLASPCNRFGSRCLGGENRFWRYRRKGSAIWSLRKARGNELGRTAIPATRVRSFARQWACLRPIGYARWH